MNHTNIANSADIQSDKPKRTYKVLESKPGHYIVGLYEGWKLIATFKAYVDKNPDFLVLYFKEFINFVRDIDTAKRKVHYSDIDFKEV